MSESTSILVSEIALLRKRVQVLRIALEPFARLGVEYGEKNCADAVITLVTLDGNDLLRARAVLEQSDDEG